jgi:hypothetical protein
MKLRINQMQLIAAISEEIGRQAQEEGITDLCVEHYQFNALIDGANVIIKEFERAKREVKPDMGFYAWQLTDETGASSKAMGHKLLGGHCNDPQAYPYDSDDFSRCYKFLIAVPEAKKQLFLMREVNKQWSNLSDKWDELSKLYEDGKLKECTALIQSLIK